jgi:hypothetical protein
MNSSLRRPAIHVGGFLFFALTAFLAPSAPAQGYKVEQVSAPAPQELSAAVRAVLGDQELRVSGPGGLICEVWLRKVVPAKTPGQDLGVAYPQLDEGTLVAAVKFASTLKDYRKQEVHAGVYTLRYALSPVNGNHQGVAPQRDFLLAIPAAVDQDPATLTEAQTIELSRKSTTTNHPSVWCLMPGEGDASAAPAISHDTSDDLWIVNFTVPLGSAPTRIGLVVNGTAPEA